MSNQLLVVLRDVINENFNEGELREFCFELSVDYDNLPGSTKVAKGRELVTFLKRRGRLNDLTKIGSADDNDIDWAAILNDPSGIDSNDPPRLKSQSDISENLNDSHPPHPLPDPPASLQPLPSSALVQLTSILASLNDFATQDGREVMVTLAGVSDVVGGISLSGTSRTIAGKIVISLYNFGLMAAEGTETALGNLLNYILSLSDLRPVDKNEIEKIVNTYQLYK